MKKLALSIKNPYSYLVCAGAKWVENRTWKTDYRGRIYIHSSGDYRCDMIPFSKVVPETTRKEFAFASEKYKGIHGEELKSRIKADFKEVHKDFLTFVDGYERLFEYYKNFYGCDLSKLEKDEYARVFKEKGYCFDNFKIIGHVDLVDIVKDADSDWAEDCYNWILENPVLYDSPVENVKGKLRLFDVSHVDMPDD